TFDSPEVNDMPLWSADGSGIVFRSRRQILRTKALAGAGSDAPLLSERATRMFTPLGWSRDGRSLLYEAAGGPKTITDLWVLPIAGDRHPVPWLQTPFDERQGQLSPDGRWIAYVSNESSQNEVYVRPFPAGNGKWRVSTSGGSEPRW